MNFIDIGVKRMHIAYALDNLEKDASQQYYKFNRMNELGEYTKQEHIESSKSSYKKMISVRIKEINASIESYNESSSEIFEGREIKRISYPSISTEIEGAFQKQDGDQEAYNLVSPYIQQKLAAFLNSTFIKVYDDLIAHKIELEDYSKSFKVDTFPEAYRDEIEQMIDIYVMGYKSTALLVLGRIFEKIMTVWGNGLIDKQIIEKTVEEFRELRFENILGLFKGKYLISEKEWHILSKLRLDRNIGGHYLSDDDTLARNESEEEAEMTIRLALPLIKKYHTNIEKMLNT